MRKPISEDLTSKEYIEIIDKLHNKIDEVTETSLEQINAMKAEIEVKKDLIASPFVVKDGDIYDIIFPKLKIIREGIAVETTAEELASDEAECHRLINLKSGAFVKRTVAE